MTSGGDFLLTEKTGACHTPVGSSQGENQARISMLLRQREVE